MTAEEVLQEAQSTKKRSPVKDLVLPLYLPLSSPDSDLTMFKIKEAAKDRFKIKGGRIRGGPRILNRRRRSMVKIFMKETREHTMIKSILKETREHRKPLARLRYNCLW